MKSVVAINRFKHLTESLAAAAESSDDDGESEAAIAAALKATAISKGSGATAAAATEEQDPRGGGAPTTLKPYTPAFQVRALPAVGEFSISSTATQILVRQILSPGAAAAKAAEEAAARAASRAAAPAKRQFNEDYKLRGQLGAGSFSVVHKCTANPPLPHGSFAVKVC